MSVMLSMHDEEGAAAAGGTEDNSRPAMSPDREGGGMTYRGVTIDIAGPRTEDTTRPVMLTGRTTAGTACLGSHDEWPSKKDDGDDDNDTGRFGASKSRTGEGERGGGGGGGLRRRRSEGRARRVTIEMPSQESPADDVHGAARDMVIRIDPGPVCWGGSVDRLRFAEDDSIVPSYQEACSGRSGATFLCGAEVGEETDEDDDDDEDDEGGLRVPNHKLCRDGVHYISPYPSPSMLVATAAAVNVHESSGRESLTPLTVLCTGES